MKSLKIGDKAFFFYAYQVKLLTIKAVVRSPIPTSLSPPFGYKAYWCKNDKKLTYFADNDVHPIYDWQSLADKLENLSADLGNKAKILTLKMEAFNQRRLNKIFSSTSSSRNISSVLTNIEN